MSYRIKTVASMTGIQRGTLIAWERRYDLLEPQRTESGYRLYTDRDVATLMRLKSLVEAGHPISEAVRMVRDGGRGDLVTGLLDALLRFDRPAADRMLPDPGRFGFELAIEEVYLPILRRVGDLWASGEASVAQEHFVSGWCREQMLAMFHALGGGPERGRTAACALPPEEMHELGALGVAVRLALRGWRVTWLSSLPVDELRRYVRNERPSLLCVSFVQPRPEAEIRAYLHEIAGGTRLVVGGAAVRGLVTDDAEVAPTWELLASRLDPRTDP